MEEPLLDLLPGAARDDQLTDPLKRSERLQLLLVRQFETDPDKGGQMSNFVRTTTLDFFSFHALSRSIDRRRDEHESKSA
ncbi:hypothetical protein PU629_13725 [Pullulanibacillus sp. KACC 23026]|uniref:hypothetical protein n=1 Tax=Pullulanibacillus sp. KACC 23026 TaxID=3028315 RepID=UPI0023B12303|nr:hypothetical protein [Pullulanibacillus sp. KACC 23026]WEG11221.1 hypothetical protein PU629_13725 [Pullulanibacillus sp. KACC 23026]